MKTVPPGTLKGAFQCTLRPDGILFKQGKKLEFLVPVGTPAEYVKENRLRLHLPQYQIEMSITLMSSFSYRLTRDLAAFMNAQMALPQAEAYRMPWLLVVLALLPMGILVVTRGGAIFGAAGGALSMVNYAFLQKEDWPLPLRVAAALGVTAAAYAGAIGMVASAGSGQPF